MSLLLRGKAGGGRGLFLSVWEGWSRGEKGKKNSFFQFFLQEGSSSRCSCRVGSDGERPGGVGWTFVLVVVVLPRLLL